MKRLILFVLLDMFVWINSPAQCNCGVTSSSASIGEAANSSLSLRKKQWVIELYGDYRVFAHTSDDHSNHIHSHDTVMLPANSINELNNMLIAFGNIRYGLTSRITLSLKQPQVWLNATPLSITGPGDLVFTASVKVFDKNEFSGAILAGTEFPTGRKSKLSGENSLAIGSGSYDPLAGLAFVKAWHRSFIRTSVYYKYSGDGYDNTNFGSFLNCNFTFDYKLKEAGPVCKADSLNTVPRKFSWTVFVNIAEEWYNEQVKENIVIKNTGGAIHLIGIGTQVGLGKWYVPVSVTIPVVQRFQGEQSQSKFRIRIGIIKIF